MMQKTLSAKPSDPLICDADDRFDPTPRLYSLRVGTKIAEPKVSGCFNR